MVICPVKGYTDSVIQILGILSIDGDHSHIPQIPAAGTVCLGYRLGYPFHLVHDLLAEFHRQIKATYDRHDVYTGIVDYEICESVIRVNKRMSYTVVKKLLEEPECVEHNASAPDGTAGESAGTVTDYSQYRELLPMFRQMAELADKLRKKRQKRGSIDFDFPECKILLDKEGHPLDIKPYERNVATMLIEDFMLAANETVAQHFYWQELPFVYRVHDVPDPERIQKLSTFISNYGYYMKALGRKKHCQFLFLHRNIKIILHQITDYFFSLLSDFVITHVTSLNKYL